MTMPMTSNPEDVPTQTLRAAPAGPKQLSFDRIPHLYELIQHNGLIGVTYAHVAVANLAFAESSGLRRVEGLLCYLVCGAWATLMSAGKPQGTGRTTSQLAVVKSDPALLAIVAKHNGPAVDAPARAPVPPAVAVVPLTVAPDGRDTRDANRHGKR